MVYGIEVQYMNIKTTISLLRRAKKTREKTHGKFENIFFGKLFLLWESRQNVMHFIGSSTWAVKIFSI